ncbi:anti-sigma factor RsbA family regulatory protein [Actinomadura scrupuli]|uniref:anti-sigma factor RsbA family regulatory protein n=1 Tax=Actinomadura scrupuli TaxID=559629 RepID=UPI003D95CE64
MTVTDAFVHPAVLYRGEHEYVTALIPFIRAGLDAGDPVAVAVPGQRLRLLRDALRESGPAPAGQVEWIDMTVAGRNPGRIIPGILRAFADRHPDAERIRIIGEPIWPGRSRVEYPACVHHEALINLAFAGRSVTILCPYDAAGLDPGTLADAAATHPVLIDHGEERVSSAYAPEKIIDECNLPLDRIEAGDVAVLHFDAGDLIHVRGFAAEHAARLGLRAERVLDLEVAVNELAANSVLHGGGRGTLRIWAEDAQLLCQVDDAGHLGDPLAGRLPVGLGCDGGRGLLLVHHIADLVRVHTSPGSATFRLYFALGPGDPGGRPAPGDHR